MACTITQADLGPDFAAVNAALVQVWIDVATSIVSGADGTNQVLWANCNVDPCMAIRLLASHAIATDPSSGVNGYAVTSESVADVSTSYAAANSSSDLWSSTPWGRGYSQLLRQYEICSSRRKHIGFVARVGRRCG